MERLNAADLAMLWPDDFGWPQDIGAIGVLDAGALVGPDGQLRVEGVRAAIESRLHRVPRFRQVLCRPSWGLGGPLWVDAAAFDIREHVRVEPLPAPGDESQMLATVERLRREKLDRSRPLWQIWLLPGLPNGRVGLYARVHHAIADGVAGIVTLAAFLDTVPDAPAPGGRPWRPEPPPSTRALLQDSLRRRADAVRGLLAALARPGRALSQLRAAWPTLREAFAEERAPRSSLNRPIGPARRVGLIRGSLDLAKQIAHAHGATVNDVLLTAMTAGLRELLVSRGEAVDGLVLRAAIPISLHGEQQARGNLDGAMLVPLPVGERDLVRALGLVSAETAVRKRLSRVPSGVLFRNHLLQWAFLHALSRQRWSNVYEADVPGPPVPLHLAGAQLVELFPLVPLTGNFTLGLGALSYAGQLNLAAVADPDACRDLDVFIAGVRGALRYLATRPAHPAAGSPDGFRPAGRAS
ncbi:MAG: wax ester/triacylglycerol synthase family O-acyltransferase [Frankiaceae bacterium]